MLVELITPKECPPGPEPGWDIRSTVAAIFGVLGVVSLILLALITPPYMGTAEE